MNEEKKWTICHHSVLGGLHIRYYAEGLFTDDGVRKYVERYNGTENPYSDCGIVFQANKYLASFPRESERMRDPNAFASHIKSLLRENYITVTDKDGNNFEPWIKPDDYRDRMGTVFMLADKVLEINDEIESGRDNAALLPKDTPEA